MVSPDCGLKLLPREAAYAKMANRVQVARNVEADLDAEEIEVGAVRGFDVAAD